MSLNLRNIPRIMRQNNMPNGAVLLDKWFSRAATTTPNYSTPDTSTITMDWVLGYDKPRALYDSIFSERVWANDAARRTIVSRLQAAGKMTGFPETFDQTVRTPQQLENEYVNFRPYGGGYSGYSSSGYSGYSSSGYSGSGASGDMANLSSALAAEGLNDLVAALGAFTFRIVIAGSTTPTLPRGRQVTITKVGVYIRDSFDFEGFQFLGFWNDSRNTVSALNFFGGSAVFNSSFRDYRNQNNMGGDFMVFSNVLVTTLREPHVFML